MIKKIAEIHEKILAVRANMDQHGQVSEFAAQTTYEAAVALEGLLAELKAAGREEGGPPDAGAAIREADPGLPLWATGQFTQEAVFYNMLMAWPPEQCRKFYAMLSRRPDFNPEAGKPGEGYRLLVVGDIVEASDEVWAYGKGPWGPVNDWTVGKAFIRGYNPMRRRVETPAASAAGRPDSPVPPSQPQDPVYAMRKFSCVPWAQVIGLLGSRAYPRDGGFHFQYRNPGSQTFRNLIVSDNGGEYNVHEEIPALGYSLPIPAKVDVVEFASTLAEALHKRFAQPQNPGEQAP